MFIPIPHTGFSNGNHEPAARTIQWRPVYESPTNILNMSMFGSISGSENNNATGATWPF